VSNPSEEDPNHPLSEGYAEREAKRIRAARLQTEADHRERRRRWDEQRAKPFGQRQFFGLGEIADGLARNPRSLVIDSDLRERVSQQLVEWVQTQQFRAGEVATLSGDPPDFRSLELPLPPAGGGIVLLPEEPVALWRDACRRYVVARAELPGAASLLRDWFGDEVPEPEGASAPRPGAAKPGRTPGEPTAKDLACGIAPAILADDDRRPPRGYGRLIAVARLVKTELHRYADESITKMIRPTVRDWEKAHPRE
jgi:hypothetical protein